jgi:hypothetical protein
MDGTAYFVMVVSYERKMFMKLPTGEQASDACKPSRRIHEIGELNYFLSTPPTIMLPQWNTNGRGSLGTIDLLIKVPCYVKK